MRNTVIIFWSTTYTKTVVSSILQYIHEFRLVCPVKSITFILIMYWENGVFKWDMINIDYIVGRKRWLKFETLDKRHA